MSPNELLNDPERRTFISLADSLKEDIRQLSKDQTVNFKELISSLNNLQVKIAKVEVKQDNIDTLDKEFKAHSKLMLPIRDEVLGIKKLSKAALVLAGMVPILLGILVKSWHPWSDTVRDQLTPVYKQMQDMSAKQQSDIARISTILNNQSNQLTTLESTVNRDTAYNHKGK